MSAPLLQTKLHLPRHRRGIVARPRLSEQLSRAGEAALTLVSAPAGFGKTTLVTQLLAAAGAEGAATAWLSLDQRDNDPALFWTYVIAALDRAVPGVGGRALALMGSAGAPLEDVIEALLNDLLAVEQEIVLVLDDYHVVESRGVQESMVFLVEHLPAHLHLVVAARADPALPIARLRARGDLVEIRATDLRFTPQEAAEYLIGSMGLAVSAADVEVLESRTEGWIAALQLAALSLQGREDTAGFLAGFAGDDRFVVDYLVEEVLQRQSPAVRSFLLRTSVLRRLTGRLCDAVTGQEGGKDMLDALERGNLFVVPLDDRREWYRYHHLFADVLRARLLDEEPEALAVLHGRASEWWEQAGERPEAISHAMAGGLVSRAADLVELAIPEMSQGRRESTLRRWIQDLPAEEVAARPVLSVGHAAMALVHGELGEVDAHLSDAERWVDLMAGAPAHGALPAGMVVADHESLGSLPAAIAVFRAAQAWILGDGTRASEHARRALDHSLAQAEVTTQDHQRRGAAAGILALASWAAGELDRSHAWWLESQQSLERAGYLADLRGCALAMADIRIVQGRLGEALSTVERWLPADAASGQGDEAAPVLRGTADMHVAMAGLLLERGDLVGATEHLEASAALGEHLGLPQNRHRSRLALAGARQAEGDLDGALALIDEAERLYNGDLFPQVRPIAALRARLWLAQGRVAEALRWAQERGLAVDDELDYRREVEHLTLARVLLAQHEADGAPQVLEEASRLLERLLSAAEEGGRTGSVIEILVLRALAEQAGGDVERAIGTLHRALLLAEPEGHVRLVVDAGPRMVPLLRAAARAGISPGYVRRLLGAMTTDDGRRPVTPGLIDQLSERELEVLRLLAGDLDGPAIARELFISLNTMRTHTKNIFTKLGVTSRRAAVSRAAELDLLTRPREH